MDLALYKQFRKECDAAYPESLELDCDPPRRRPAELPVYPPRYGAGFFVSGRCVTETFRVPPIGLLSWVETLAAREKKGIYFSMIPVTKYDYLVCFAHTADDKRDIQDWFENRDEWFDLFCRMLRLNEKARDILARNYKWHRIFTLDKSVRMPPEVSLPHSDVIEEGETDGE